MDNNDQGAALAAWAVKHGVQAQLVNLTNSACMTGVPALVPALLTSSPDGSRKFTSVKAIFDEYRTHPEQRTGTANMGDLASFIAHSNRFSNMDSAIFADPDRSKPSLLTVFDYHQAVNVSLPADLGEDAPIADGHAGRGALPQYGAHRCLYKFPLSDEWEAWKAIDGKGLSQIEFAEFLEDRINDIANPPFPDDSMATIMAAKLGSKFADAARLMELSRSLKVHVDHKFKGSSNISSGEAQISWTEEHKDEAGAPLVVPNLFVIAIPVFRNGERFPIPVRLRYRLNMGKATWFMQRYQEDIMFDLAFSEAANQAHEATGLPLFVGTPEAKSS